MKSFLEEHRRLVDEASDVIIAIMKEHGEKCEMWTYKERPFNAYRLKVGRSVIYHPLSSSPTCKALINAPYRGIWWYTPISNGREHYDIVKDLEVVCLADELTKKYNK